MFQKSREEGRGALMPFVVAGHPSIESLPTLFGGLERAGADAIEVGIPFSDPIADGPVIAAAMHEALVGGVTVEGVLETVAGARDGVQLPLIAMASVSIVDRLGGPAFLDRLADHGFDGLILPDADLDATAPIRDRAESLDLAFTTLIAPDTATERAARIAADAREFVYVLARRGLTGARTDAPDLTDRMTQLRALTDLPLAAGFGISTANHVAAVLEHADGAIVGSALVGVMDQASAAGSDAVEAASGLVASMAASVGRSVD